MSLKAHMNCEKKNISLCAWVCVWKEKQIFSIISEVYFFLTADCEEWYKLLHVFYLGFACWFISVCYFLSFTKASKQTNQPYNIS